MTSIKIIIPYFGKFPPQFKFWWKSALNNPGVTFLLITDNHDVKTEQNIKVVYMTFAECQVLVKKLFPFEVALFSPYKLCDLKPCYPLIFRGLYEDTDFIGWGDIDLIYGDLRSFVTEDVLEKYDVISGWGHFTLLRNNEYWRNFFMEKADGFQDYKEVMQSQKSFGFDEYWHGGLADKAKALHPDKVWDPMSFDDLNTPEQDLGFVSSNRKVFENSHLMFEYSDGQMWRIYTIGYDVRREPTMYMHFKRRQSVLKICTENTAHYIIVPNRIIPYETLTWGKVMHFTNYGLMQQWLYRLKCKANRKLKKILHI